MNQDSNNPYKPENSDWEKFLEQTKNNANYTHVHHPVSYDPRPIKTVHQAITEFIEELQRNCQAEDAARAAGGKG